MSKISVKQTGDFFTVKTIRNYKTATVEAEINDQKALFTFEEHWNDTRLANWRVILDNGGHGKEQIDFSALEVFGITEVDITDITKSAQDYFAKLKEQEKKEEEETARRNRATIFDSHPFITQIKPELEKQGYTVSVSISKQNFIDGKGEVALKVNDTIYVGREYHGWVAVHNSQYGSDRVEKVTKSEKIAKILECIQYVINTMKDRAERKKQEKDSNHQFKEKLEKAVGEEMVQMIEHHYSDYHDRKRGGRSYDTVYFVRKFEKDSPEALRFREVSQWNSKDQKHETAVAVSKIPVFKLEDQKLEALVALLST
jgi:hypothetical protein